jgi:hypothetical protein
MPEIRDVGADDYIRMLLYSYPGWGKTSLIGSAADAGMKVLIIRSKLDHIPKRVLGSGTKQMVCNTHDEMLEALEYLQHDGKDWDWVWWDCISVAQDVLLDDIWEATVDRWPHRAYKDVRGGLDKGEYGRNMEQMQQWVRHVVGCNTFNFGITAHPFWGPHPAKEKDAEEQLLGPWIQGRNMPQKICGYMNMVGFMELKESKEHGQWRRLHFKENSNWYAKDQYDAFVDPGYIDNPSMDQIMSRVNKARGVAPQRPRRGTPTRAPGRQGRKQAPARPAGRRS